MDGVMESHHFFEGNLGLVVTGRREKGKGSLCHTIFWGEAMGFLHALEEGASNLLRPTGHDSSVQVSASTEKGSKAVAFFGGEGVRQKLMFLMEFKAYS